MDEIDAVHISVAFTWDLERARMIATAWRGIAPVTIGGPALDDPGGSFTPGLYLKVGYVMTSRGCPNRCGFCMVPRREGPIRELPIEEGYNVLDSNLLACSYGHVCSVIDMLGRQKMGRPQFTGGLEAERFEAWTAEAVRSVRPVQVFFAYDEPRDWDPLVRAVELCWKVGFTPKAHRIRAYVLCRWQRETIQAAEERMERVKALGVVPAAMLWKDASGREAPREWQRFQRRWIRPAITASQEVQ